MALLAESIEQLLRLKKANRISQQAHEYSSSIRNPDPNQDRQAAEKHKLAVAAWMIKDLSSEAEDYASKKRQEHQKAIQFHLSRGQGSPLMRMLRKRR